MIKVRIGTVEREGDSPTDFDAGWIGQELAQSGAPDSVCVMVTIDTSNIKMVLASSACPPSRGGRELYPDEQRVYDLWAQFALDGSRTTQHQLLGFLQQLRNLA